MIYILMEYVPEYSVDNHPKPVFASTSKEVIEKKHDELVAYYSKYKNLFDRWHADIQRINRENPSPTHVNRTDMPRRPLVWRDNNWEEYYIADYREALQKHIKLVGEKTDQLKLEYIEFYKEAEPDIVNIMDRIYSFAAIPSYTVEEVESD